MDKIAQLLIEPLRPKWGPAPAGSSCPECGSTDMERSMILAGGPWAGHVRCKCGFTSSVSQYLLRTCVKVEPLK